MTFKAKPTTQKSKDQMPSEKNALGPLAPEGFLFFFKAIEIWFQHILLTLELASSIYF